MNIFSLRGVSLDPPPPPRYTMTIPNSLYNFLFVFGYAIVCYHIIVRFFHLFDHYKTSTVLFYFSTVPRPAATVAADASG